MQTRRFHRFRKPWWVVGVLAALSFAGWAPPAVAADNTLQPVPATQASAGWSREQAGLSVTGATASVGNGPFTIQTTLHVGETWGDEVETIWLAGLGKQQAPPDALALLWEQGTWSWFPSWRLQLSSAYGLAPFADSKAQSQAGEPLVLSTVRPALGHTYESLLSYAPDLQAVSVALTDVTDQKLIYAGTFRISGPLAGLHPAAGVKSGASRAVAAAQPQIAELQVSPAYVPVWSNWEVGAQLNGDGAYTPAYLFERNTALAVRLTAPNPSASAQGEYRVVMTSGGSSKTAVVRNIGDSWAPLDLTNLPLGKANISLQYVQNGRVWLSETRPVYVGSIALRVDPLVVDPASKTLHGNVHIFSGSDLTGFELKMQAALSKMVWDNDKRAYKEELVRQIPLFAQQNPLAIAGSSADIPFSVPLPAEPGLWKIVAQPVGDTELHTEVSNNEQYFATYASANLQPGEPFTIAILPDTQGYTNSLSEIFTRQADWIAEHAVDDNIALMLQLGDVTQDNKREQWEIARRSLSLLDPVVPYVLAVGNHDMAPAGGVRARGETLINDYFPVSKFPALGGTFAPNRVEDSYHLFNIAGMDLMVVSLEFGPPDDVLAWANEVVAAHPNHKVIVITHTYTNRDGSRGGDPKRYGLAHNANTTVNDGKDMWNKFISKHANILMVLSGHIGVPTIPHHVDIGEHGNFVYGFLMDYQGEPQGGNGWMVLISFNQTALLMFKAIHPIWAGLKPKPTLSASTTISRSIWPTAGL